MTIAVEKRPIENALFDRMLCFLKTTANAVNIAIMDAMTDIVNNTFIDYPA
jgi:hypothetical protein